MYEERKRWLDNPRNVWKIVYGVFILAGLMILFDLLYSKHPHFGMEGIFGFYGFYGFVACVVLVIAAKGLRVLLKRDEDYYD
ncbi:hypothetical protein ACFL6T_00670 [Candidatus Zixiibacteriota bacterium]